MLLVKYLNRDREKVQEKICKIPNATPEIMKNVCKIKRFSF